MFLLQKPVKDSHTKTEILTWCVWPGVTPESQISTFFAYLHEFSCIPVWRNSAHFWCAHIPTPVSLVHSMIGTTAWPGIKRNVFEMFILSVHDLNLLLASWTCANRKLKVKNFKWRCVFLVPVSKLTFSSSNCCILPLRVSSLDESSFIFCNENAEQFLAQQSTSSLSSVCTHLLVVSSEINREVKLWGFESIFTRRIFVWQVASQNWTPQFTIQLTQNVAARTTGVVPCKYTFRLSKGINIYWASLNGFPFILAWCLIVRCNCLHFSDLLRNNSWRIQKHWALLFTSKGTTRICSISTTISLHLLSQNSFIYLVRHVQNHSGL